VQQKFGIALPVRTMRHYLKQWGFTAQKPLKQAYEPRPEASEAWLKTEYPRIKRRALAEGAANHWAMRTAVALRQRARRRSGRFCGTDGRSACS
jgi:hypothetical protein